MQLIGVWSDLQSSNWASTQSSNFHSVASRSTNGNCGPSDEADVLTVGDSARILCRKNYARMGLHYPCRYIFIRFTVRYRLAQGVHFRVTEMQYTRFALPQTVCCCIGDALSHRVEQLCTVASIFDKPLDLPLALKASTVEVRHWAL
jgi:hypothetical protein